MTIKTNVLILASAARTATPTVPALDSTLLLGSSTSALLNVTDIHIVIDVTLDAAAASVQPLFQGFDAISSSWYDLVDSITAITATGTTSIRYGEKTGIVANIANQGFIPEAIRLVLTHADGDAITYSVAANIMVRG